MTSRRLEPLTGRWSRPGGALPLLGALVAAGLLGCGSVDESSGLIGSGSSVQVVINEVVSEGGNPSDWIELYNLDEEPANLSGFYLGDKLEDPLEAELGDVEIPGHGVVVINADDTGMADPPVVAIKLSKDGDAVILSDAHGLLVDKVSFGVSAGDGTSFARHPDGTGTPEWCGFPTRGALNGDACGG